jgi:arginyl-tRNA synthetase
MSEGVRARVEDALRELVRSRFGIELAQMVSERPPRTELGDLAFPVAFELARALKKAPRKIAEELKDELSRVEGVSRVDVAGAGYLNVFFDRAPYLESFLAPAERKTARAKVIVEHTNINPNKAAHIGHLRNAALGDTFVRTLRFCGENVEVQNYIDDTGVQVADVVVGFLHLEKKTQAEVEALAASDHFDYYCWDLYARISQFFQGDRERLRLREHTLKAIEEGEAPEGPLGALIADKIVRCHLNTMDRIDVRYDLLPWESDILRLKFWQRAYELLQERKAIRLSVSGKNHGCWVMDLSEGAESEADPDEPDTSDEKVIVRSNGTVTYVGKDIAYQMWKLGLLDRQFGFRPFHRYPDGATVWSTAAESTPGAPDFGKGERVYNVIDVRQAYLQNVVQRGVALLASEEARERSRHFSYEMVALTPATCRELGFPVSPDEEKKPYLEVSGRKGLGVKADDLLDALEKKAGEEVAKRNPELPKDAQKAVASAIARGALRYFMIKFTKNKVIAFDFNEALSFEGDSGPYVQYAAVRAAKILSKLGRAKGQEIALPANLEALFASLALEGAEEAEDLWSLVLGAADLGDIATTVVRTEEPAHLARHALTQAQAFNAFYHRYRVLNEPDEGRRALRLLAVEIFYRQQVKALGLMGIPVPERM